MKRGSKDRASETEDSKPSKKIKVEEDSGSLEEEVRRHHKKGTLSKVSHHRLSTRPRDGKYDIVLTGGFLAYGRYPQGLLDFQWTLKCR